MDPVNNPTTPAATVDRMAETQAIIKEVMAESSPEDLSFSTPVVDDNGNPVESASDPEGTEEEAPPEAHEEKAPVITDERLAAIEKAKESGDLVALAEALDLDDKAAAKLFKVRREDFISLRSQKKEQRERDAEFSRKVSEAETRLQSVKDKLLSNYGEHDTIQKALLKKDVDGAVVGLEKIIKMPIQDFMKLIHKHYSGQNTESIMKDRKLREYEEREAASKKEPEAPAPKNDQKQYTEAMDWIATGIKGDKFEKYPNIKQLVFDVLVRDNHKGVKTPLAALEIVKQELAAFGLGGESKKKEPTALSKTPPRRNTSGQFEKRNSRPMTDQEMIREVLSEIPASQLWK